MAEQVGATVPVGTRIRTWATLAPLGSASPADPDGVFVLVRAPGGEVEQFTYGTDAEVTKDDVGRYSFTHLVDAAGTWWFSWHAESEVTGPSAVQEVAVRAERNAVEVPEP